MPPALDELTTHGYDLVAAGDLASARAVLEDGLSAVDLAGGDVAPDIAEAASLYARVLLAGGETPAARDWAAYAHGVAVDLYGRADARTIRDAATLAAALHRAGELAEAEHLYREVIARLTERDGPDSAQPLAARADLATVLHARGRCAAARAELSAALNRYAEVFGPAEPAGIRMLARLAAMARDCGDPAEAARHFTRARALCRERLPADHPVAVQVAALAAAPANPAHPCGAAAEPPPTDDDDLGWWPPEAPTEVRAPPWERRPPQPDAPWAGQPQPAASWAEAEPGVWAPDGHPPQPAPRVEPRPTAANLPVPRQSPVPRHLSPSPPRRRIWRTVAIGVVLAVLGVAAGWWIARAIMDRAAAPPQQPAPAGETTGSGPPTAPTAVTLRDGRDSVTLSWTYPGGAEGQVLVSGSRSGASPRAFITLPAGSTTYTVYGLADSADYCFTIAVVYSTDVVARADPVCTGRAAPSGRR